LRFLAVSEITCILHTLLTITTVSPVSGGVRHKELQSTGLALVIDSHVAEENINTNEEEVH
jgi:hypothetical protein